MTLVGGGGVSINTIETTRRFDKDFSKLDTLLKDLVREKLAQLLSNPIPAGLRFEKLKGYRKPSIYTIHITGNYKVSIEITGEIATLRRIACHNDIDRLP